MNKYFGIDSSLRATGFATYNDDFGTREKTSLIIPPKNLRGMGRLQYIRDGLIEHLTPLNQWSGGAIEGFAMGARGRAVTEIFGIGCILRLVLWEAGLHTIEIPPPTLKKFITGKGTASKIEMILAVNKLFRLEMSDDNEVDALAAAYFAAAYAQQDIIGLAKFRMECLPKARVLS